MRYFPSGADSSENMEILRASSFPDAMLSYYYSFYQKSEDRLDRAFNFCKLKSVFLDSGGYTARIKGINLDINEYASFIDKHGDKFFKISNLDVMDWKKSQENFEILKRTKFGYKVIQIYHANDYARGLKQEYIDLVKDNNFIGLGGIAGERWQKSAVRKFQDFVFYHALKSKTAIHGFGMMSHFNVVHYPFYSVDSTSWLQAGRWGGVPIFNGKSLVIKRRAGKHDLAKNSRNTRITPYSYIHRIPASIETLANYGKYCQYITGLWKLKGVTWTN